MGEVVTAMEYLGRVEGNKAVNQLANAWEKLDWDNFKLALDSVLANLDPIRRADCD